MHGDYEVAHKEAELLLKNGLGINEVDDDGFSYLHYLCFYSVEDVKEKPDFEKMAQFFIDKGIDINLKSESGNTALDLCEGNERVKSAKFLRQFYN